MKVCGAVLLLALLGSPAAADDVSDLLAAISKRDIATLKARSKLPLRVSYVWFPDPKCSAFSQDHVVVEAAQLTLLVDCLVDLGLKRDTGRGSAMYEPGMRLLFDLERGVLRSLRGSNSEPLRIFVESEVFRAHVTSGLDALPKPPSDDAFVELRVCASATGGVYDIKVLDQSKHADFAAAVETAVRGWTTSPFTRGGKAMRVCAIERHAASPVEPPTPTSPPGAPINIPPQALEANRIAGKLEITPDEKTKKAILASKKNRLVGSWKLCLNNRGAISEVTVLKGTGVPAYDAKVESDMRGWRYRPWLVDGKAVPICTVVTVIY
jgi:hypothetical protein